MKNFKINIAFGVLVGLAVLGFVFEDKIRLFLASSGSMDITEIQFKDISGRNETLNPNFRGYVIFYSDLVGCTICLQRLSNLNGLEKSYPEIGFYGIAKHANEGKAFAEMLFQFEIPGTFLVDDLQIIKQRFLLADKPILLFFNRNRTLIASLPLDVEYENLKKQIHLFLNEY